MGVPSVRQPSAWTGGEMGDYFAEDGLCVSGGVLLRECEEAVPERCDGDSSGGDQEGARGHAFPMEAPGQAEAGNPGHGAGDGQRREGERGAAGAPPEGVDQEGAVLPGEDVHGGFEGGSGLQHGADGSAGGTYRGAVQDPEGDAGGGRLDPAVQCGKRGGLEDDQSEECRDQRGDRGNQGDEPEEGSALFI